MNKTILITAFLVLSCHITNSADPVSVYPANPHYFMYKGKPILLITSDQHYGAVANSEFDYAAFLKKLKSKGLNFTRIYPGSYIEKENAFIKGNVLGIRNGKQILPWARTSVQGAHPVQGGLKYDLDKWDEAYFARLRDYCSKARSMGIIVEICFFNGEYSPESGMGGWPIQAFNASNNINDVGNCEWNMVMSLTGDPKLVEYQEKYVREITRRLNDFDNIIFHIADEPGTNNKGAKVYGPWVSRMIDAFWSVENTLPVKHVLGQTVDVWMLKTIADFSDDDRIQYIDIEYSRGRSDLANEYMHNKPINLIETGYYPVFYRGKNKMDDCRVEAWEFMIGGCAGFMNLNGLYSTDNATGKGTEIDTMLQDFVNLKNFMNSFNIASMKRDLSFIESPEPEGSFTSAMCEPGKQYAFYIHHSVFDKPKFPNTYIVTPGNYQETFTFRLPEGKFDAEWIDPYTGKVSKKEKVVHNGGSLSLTAPMYSMDIALRMKSAK